MSTDTISALFGAAVFLLIIFGHPLEVVEDEDEE